MKQVTEIQKGPPMAIFTGELGLQFVTHLANHYTVPDLIRLAQFAADKGFKQIWVNDNLRYRGQLVVLTAIAARVPIQLGTASWCLTFTTAGCGGLPGGTWRTLRRP